MTEELPRMAIGRVASETLAKLDSETLGKALRELQVHGEVMLRFTQSYDPFVGRPAGPVAIDVVTDYYAPKPEETDNAR